MPFVLDTPVGVGTESDTETYFAALGSQVTLSFTVHCYPEARFVWQKGKNRISSAAFESFEFDRYLSSVVTLMVCKAVTTELTWSLLTVAVHQ